MFRGECCGGMPPHVAHVIKNPKGLNGEYQDHWSEHGRPTSVGNSDALGRPRRSVGTSGCFHIMSAFEKSFHDLRIIGLDTERSHATAGAMARIYLQLSEPSPLGWSYMFTTVWQAAADPLKCPAGVEGNSIWIDCLPEDFETRHHEQIESAVAQTNAKYRDAVCQQALKASRPGELNVQVQSRLRDLNRTLYPASDLSGSVAAPPRYFGSRYLATLARFLFRNKRRKSDG